MLSFIFETLICSQYDSHVTPPANLLKYNRGK